MKLLTRLSHNATRAWNVWSARRTKPVAASAPPASLIVPNARDRWLGATARQFTPERVENTLRSAMSGSLVAQWELFDLMESTWPRLQKNLGELKRAVASLEWELQAKCVAGEKPSPAAEQRKALVEELVWSMRPRPECDENDFQGTLRDLMDAWGKGIAVLEIDWSAGIITNGGDAISPVTTRWIHPRYYGYPTETKIQDRLFLDLRELSLSGADTARLNNVSGQWAEFLPDKFLIAVAKARSGHPTGAALLRSLAFWWCASNFSAEWLLNYAQIFGQPIRWATYDTAKPGLLDLISEMLENMGSAGWAAMPAGTQLELKEAARSGQDNPQAYILNLADRVCDVLVLGQTLTTDVSGSGSRALGEVHQSVRDDVIQAAADWVAGILNSQFIPAICRLNYGDDSDCPWFMPARKQVKDACALAERDQILLRAGVALPRTWFYERHDIPIPAGGEAVIQNSSSPASRSTGEAAPATH